MREITHKSTGFEAVGATPTSAIFSDCRLYRYALWRRWSHGELIAFVGLNPSTADETLNDPTIRRCIGFAKDWGYGGLAMLNIFAYRATDPMKMKSVADPVGPLDYQPIVAVAGMCPCVVTAWGVHGEHLERGQKVLHVLRTAAARVCHLGLTKQGMPKHPLYLKSCSERIDWN